MSRSVSDLLTVTHPHTGPHHRSRRAVRPAPAVLQAAHDALASILRNASLPERLRFTEFADKHMPQSCRACNIVGHNLIQRIRDEDDVENIGQMVIDLCSRLNVGAPHVCRGLVKMNAEIVHYVLQTTPDIDTAKVCAALLSECDDGRPELQWPLSVALGRRPPIKPQPFVTDLRPITRKERPVRILHATDFHYDTKYKVGGNAKCGIPTCCRNDQGNPSNPSAKAGRWGDYRFCDIPWDTVVEFCQHANETHKNQVDFVYFTGDIVDHGVWDTSRETNSFMLRASYRTLRETFGTKKVFPVVGNHEPHPLNVFAPGDMNLTDTFSSRWLYELLVEEWSHWLPEDTRETILLGGFYTVRLNNTNLRVVALNTMFCYNMNWWLMHNPVDPAGQLAWLVKVLLKAEADGEKVHILSHIPPGSHDCLTGWSQQYWRIVKRFADTIAGQFNGHSHWDEMRIFYSDDGNGTAWPFGVGWNGASITTYANVNPNYKIYLVDGIGKDASWQVKDAEIWSFNLTEANTRPDERPHWFKRYTFTKTYKLPSMHVSHLDTLVRRFATDRETRFQYWRLGSREADSKLRDGCNDDCLRPNLCNLVTTNTRNTTYCKLFFDKLL